eukprot:TRINITY_DN44568_c0_g1_i1.p1 TRINITY_DN44568_c0_g1~~TRINITY_DN44568_c0_g1_i1.p1  ORF type:complete len:277 (+),score=73.75 TRINITY_DN44568_c0_g1_i1:133-963(+)
MCIRDRYQRRVRGACWLMRLPAELHQLQQKLLVADDPVTRANAAASLQQECARALVERGPSAREQLEQAVWKACFYRPIEAKRRAIRKNAMEPGGEALLRGAMVCLMDRILEGIKFWAGMRELLLASASDLVPSVYRCHVFLGDLERYAQQHNGARAKCWDRSRREYEAALTLSPGSGHVQNQLGVLESYEHHTIAAMYRYCRAITSPTGFPQARSNLEELVRTWTPGVNRDHMSWEDVPVSYTHLRAHETPEHLVCRLLLEKKKKNTTINKQHYK